MKTILSYLSIIVALTSCAGDQHSTSDDVMQLYSGPITVAINTEEGYILNAVSGDSIQPVINSLGDVVITGVPVSAIGKIIHPDSVAQPIGVPAGEPQVVATNLNVKIVPEALTVVPVNKETLKTFTPGVDSSSIVLTNSMGDTVQTGVPIPAKGEIVPFLQPQPVNALSPESKDNAIINIQFLDVQHGLNSSYVWPILEDSRGNLWFGTHGGGVTKYNGYTFITITEKEGLSNNYVRSILEDSQGNIWFGTLHGGVTRYNGEAFMHFTEKEGLSHNGVLSILEDSDGNLWFCTDGGGVTKYDGETFIHLTEKEGLSHNYVTSILEDRDGNLWMGTLHGGVTKYNGEAFTYYTEKDGLSNNNVSSILEDSNGNIWIGTHGGGVSKYNGETFTHYTEKEGLVYNNVNSIAEGANGDIWFGTWEGLSIYNGATFTNITEEEGLSYNDINSTVEDSQGNLWLGTWGGGVNVYKGVSINHLTETEGLSNQHIFSILEDRDANLWFGSWAGVTRYNGDTFTHFMDAEGLGHNYVYSMLEDGKGILWFGTKGGGVTKYDGESFIHLTEKEGLSNNYVNCGLEDSQGILWFGTDGGISKYNGESFTHYTEREGLSNNTVHSALEDSKGILWFGTDGGISKYNGESFIHFTEREGLSDNSVWSILEDRLGNLWFGTDRGISKYNGETFTHFTEKEGLGNNSVMSIVEDRHGAIWMGTERGISHLLFEPDRATNGKNEFSAPGMVEDSVEVIRHDPIIYAYNERDGLRGMDYYWNSVLLDSSNRMWWGNGKNLTMWDMNKFKIPVEAPTVHLDRININEQFIDYRHINNHSGTGMKIDSVEKFFNYPLNLELPYNQNHLTFYYSAIDWSAPHKIEYSYKIDGFDDHWSLPSSEARVDYRNLSYGTFTFSVRAVGAAQVWSAPFEYTFTVLPPWWHTNGFRISGLLGVLSLLFVGYKARTRTYRKRAEHLESMNLQLEREVAERALTEVSLGARVKEQTCLYKVSELISSPDIPRERRLQGIVDLIPEGLRFPEMTCAQIVFEDQQYRSANFRETAWKQTCDIEVANEKTGVIDVYSLEQQPKLDEVPFLQEERKLLEAIADQLGSMVERQRAMDSQQRLEAQLRHAQRLETVGTIAGGIAHEFNNLLTPILGYLSLVQDDTDPESSTFDDLAQIDVAANSAKDLVRQILVFSRQAEQEKAPLKIHIVVKEALRLVKASLPSTVDLQTNIDANSGLVLADPNQIHQVLMNLCTNAYHAMLGNHGVLEVSLEPIDVDTELAELYENLQAGPHIRIAVSDTGHGMDRETVERIFEPFFTTKRTGEGTGLGLSVVHGIVASYGGEIIVESEPGRGTTFQVYLPRVEIDVEQESKVDEIIPRGNERILFVDDEEMVAQVGNAILEHLGYEVTIKTTSKEALEDFRSHPKRYDLVITDQIMPDLTGFELAGRLLSIRPELPIIIITGYSELVTLEECHERGIRQLVRKPFDPGDISRTIRSVLDEKRH